jgi:hypothetical protein
MNRGVLMWMGVIAVAGASAFACDVVERPALRAPAQRAVAKALPSGTYNVQSVQYDDGTGDYRVFLLDAPAGSRPVFESDDVKMARLDDAALAAGGKSTLTMDGEAATLNLTPDFQIAYVHNVTEESVDPVTGARGVTVVRQEQSFWTPFAAAMAGNMVANALFAPHYVYPPMYAAGGLRGVGSYGTSRAAALDSYRTTHGTLPQPARLAAAGTPLKRPGMDGMKAAPGGAGSSKFKTSPVSKPRPMGRPFGIRRR